ncbi:MAG: hypothetical protein J0I20_31440 [Chloroflexi bacterium]|nr:hypothetical protein [Chloroflexota bacterium]
MRKDRLFNLIRLNLIFLILILVFEVSGSEAKPVRASAEPSWMGQEEWVSPSYGAKGTIPTITPYIIAPYGSSGSASFEFILSETYCLRASFQCGLQVGWTRQQACNYEATAIFLEWWDPNFVVLNPNHYNNLCFILPDAPQRDYYTQYDFSTHMWCLGYDLNPCMMGVYDTTIGMTNADFVAAYGETTYTENQLGGPNPSTRLTISNIRSKSTLTGPINSAITSLGHTYYYTNNCRAYICPYQKKAIYDSGTLSVQNWTKDKAILYRHFSVKSE